MITDKHRDPTYWTKNIIALIVFSLEIIVALLCKENYFNGFFFLLDTISIIYLLLDIGYVTEPLFSGSGDNFTRKIAPINQKRMVVN